MASALWRDHRLQGFLHFVMGFLQSFLHSDDLPTNRASLLRRCVARDGS